MYLGGDLTKIDSFGKQLVSNDEIIAVNQSGKPARQVLGGDLPVWVSDLGNHTYYVGVFNLNATPSVVHLPWNLLGVNGALAVRDLWSHANLGPSSQPFTTILKGHSGRVFKVATYGKAAPVPSTSYEAESAILGGSASISNCTPCSGGAKVGNLGLGANNTVTFNNVYVKHAGVYRMQVDSMTVGLRSYLYSVNGGPFLTLNSGGGSFQIPAATILPVKLQAGVNTIQFGNPSSYPPDLDRIVISGNGDAPFPSASTYEAETATLSGSVSAAFSNYASGLAKAGNIGGGPGNAVTFTNVTVPSSGVYLLEVDYATSGPRSIFLTINDGTANELDLNGSTFDEPTNTVLRVQLHAGTNTLRFDNSTGYAPDLDRIVVAPTILSELFGRILH
jgi:hypothetical protein